jgi:hypothetical protein
MLFCNGTYSKEDPHIAHFTFTQKSNVGEEVSSTQKGHLGLKKCDDVSSTMLKKREKIYKEKKREKRREGAFCSPRPLLSLRPMVNTLVVWSLASMIT